MDPEAAETDAAYAQGLRLLARREHSRRELHRKLGDRGHPEAAVAVALDRLEAEGALSDRRFAEEYARSRFAKGYGPRRVAAELAGHGLTGPDLEATRLERSAERELAAAQLRRRFGAVPASGSTEQARRARYLQRRGFDPDLCAELVRGNPEEDPGF